MNPEPLTTADDDVSSYDGFLLDTRKLMSSELAAISTGDEFKTAVLLWCHAWNQTPAGSLPGDDKTLAALVHLTPTKWKSVKKVAMKNFILCSDGRFYHDTLCDDVKRAAESKRKRDDRTKNATAARQAQRNDERNVERDDEKGPNVTTSNLKLNLKVEGLGSTREVSRETIHQPTDDIEMRLREAAGWLNDPSPNLFVTGPIEAQITMGADVEMDVLPVIRRDAPRCRSPNWNYFTKGIAQAKADRLAAANLNFEGRPNAANNRKSTGSIADSFAVIDAAIAQRERELAAPEDGSGDSGQNLKLVS